MLEMDVMPLVGDGCPKFCHPCTDYMHSTLSTRSEGPAVVSMRITALLRPHPPGAVLIIN